ncbi:MAG: Gfo/Idh/MocA family protein [Anaerolineaceae bacterium]
MSSSKKLQVGVIGCGGIAQMMHLPFLMKNSDRYEIKSICDLSLKVLNLLGDRYQVPEKNRFANYEDLIHGDLDAVFITSGGDHTPQVFSALKSGKHVFVEKPLCYSLKEADALIDLAEQKKLKLMVGYMKRYDPGYLYAKQRLQEMGEIRYVQMNTLHPEEEGYLQIHGLIQADDIPVSTLREIRERDQKIILEAVGNISPALQAEYTDVLLGSMVHDINAMRGLLGEPERVLFAEHWPMGEKPGGITTTIQYPGVLRVVYTWIFLEKLRHYFQEIAIMSSTNRLRIQFPSPYLKNFPTPVIYQNMENSAAIEEHVIVSYQEAFEEEIKAFYEYVIKDIQPLTDAVDARKDIHILQDILAAFHPEGLAGEAFR